MKRKLLTLLAAAAMLLTGCGVDNSRTAAQEFVSKREQSSAEERTDTSETSETTEASHTAETTAETTTEKAEVTETTSAVPSADDTTDAESGTTTKRELESDYNAANTFVITLYPDVAPITCANFIALVEEGFYDGVIFHRVVDSFMAQGGDPTGTGMGGSEQTIKGEFAQNGVQNDLSHQRGVVSMARSINMDSASSQFFICYTDCSFLDGNYAAFGEVTEGMDVVDRFLQVERSLGSDRAISSPNTPIVMERVRMIDADADGNPRVQITMNDFLGAAS